MGLRDIGATLPPGFRFYPSDEELICHYLRRKIVNEEDVEAHLNNKGTLVEIDLHICEPWQLPEVAKLNAREWYFFNFRDRKYASGFRSNRATTSGYWKATGKDRIILDPRTKKIVGKRKTLVFYRSRAPNGIKTGWIMHEFCLETPHMPPKEDWVLCRVFHKGKAGENNDNENENENDYSYCTNTKSSPQLLIASPSSSNTNHHHYHTIPCGCQNPNTFSSIKNPSIIENKPIINHLIKNTNGLNCDDDNGTTNPGNNLLSLTPINHFPQLLMKDDHDDDNGFCWDMMDLEGNGRLI